MLQHAFFAAALTVGLAVAPSVQAQAEKEMLDKLRSEYVAAFNAGDAAKVASFYTEDAVVMPPMTERIEGRRAIEQSVQEQMKEGYGNLSLRPAETQAIGDAFFETGTYTQTVPGPNKEKMSATGNYMFLMRTSRDGKLQIIRTIANKSEPVQRKS
jgi:uncharacterized protein (TIGR02246 family)